MVVEVQKYSQQLAEWDEANRTVLKKIFSGMSVYDEYQTIPMQTAPVPGSEVDPIGWTGIGVT
jgi:hypothetical protein